MEYMLVQDMQIGINSAELVKATRYIWLYLTLFIP